MKSGWAPAIATALIVGGCRGVLGIDEGVGLDCVGASCGDASSDTSGAAETISDDTGAFDTSATEGASPDADSSGEDDVDTGALDTGVAPDTLAIDSADAADSDVTDTLDGAAGDADGGSTADTCSDDTAGDPLHCGSCATACPAPAGASATCVAGKCGYNTDIASTALWTRASAPGPYLSFFRDGKLLVAARDTTARLFDALSADPSSVAFPNAGGRPTNVLPVDVTKTEVAVSHYGGFVGFREDGTKAWENSIHGCCGSAAAGFAIDPTLRRLFIGHDITELNTDDGTTVIFSPLFTDSSGFFLSAGSLYAFYPNGSMARYARSDFAKTYGYSVPTTGPTPDAMDRCALAADETFVCAVPNIGKLVAVQKAGTLGWSVDLPNGGYPVITSTGLVVIGAKTAGGATTLRAFKLSDGSSAWSLPTTDEVIDVLVGDDAVLYVAQNAVSGVLGVDRDGGFIRYHFDNVGFPQEMLLRAGKLFAYASTQVVAFKVPAGGYDKAAPWPVRYHDNQRTRSLLSLLDY